ALAAPTLVLGMLGSAVPVQLALATPVVLWAGWPLFQRGWASIANRHLNMFTLIALGIGVAYAFSVVAVLAPGILPHAFRAHGGAPPVYFEAAAVITALVLLGQVMELRARGRTSSAIRALLGLAPKQARRLRVDRAGARAPGRAGGRARPRRGTAWGPGPAGAFPSTARCWGAGAPGTNRWPWASRSPSRRPPAARSSAGRSTGPAGSSCAPSASARTRC